MNHRKCAKCANGAFPSAGPEKMRQTLHFLDRGTVRLPGTFMAGTWSEGGILVPLRHERRNTSRQGSPGERLGLTGRGGPS
jgi:hypothetical protein